MPDISPPLRRDDLDDNDLGQAEVRMRQALQRLNAGTAQQRPGPGTGSTESPTVPPRRRRVAQDSGVLIERGPLSGAGERRTPQPLATIDEQHAATVVRELDAERAEHQRTRQALAAVRASLTAWQTALDRTERGRDAALAAIAEHEAAAAAIEAKLQKRLAAKAARQERARTARQAVEPEPARWWLSPTKRDQ